MFTQMRNIDNAFKYVRGFSMLLVLACTLISSYAVYKSAQQTAQAQNRIYILSNGKVMDAYASERRDNIPVEANEHIRNFHRYFFTLDPDEKVITGNLQKALWLADGSAKQQYDNLKESGFYNNLIAANISQTITVDSIRLDINQSPYYFRCFATQEITRPTSKVTRGLYTQGYLRSVSRSDNNPHGFLIERWAILDNQDISIKNR